VAGQSRAVLADGRIIHMFLILGLWAVDFAILATKKEKQFTGEEILS
jgi:hypothetical protein